MCSNFGWKAVGGILLVTGTYYLRFRAELTQLHPQEVGVAVKERRLPTRIIVTHLL
jgi:hypothetical protein